MLRFDKRGKMKKAEYNTPSGEAIEFYIFYPHQLPEECSGVKYHIIDDDRKNPKTLLNFSSNGEPITMQWCKANIETTNIVCKRCAAKLKTVLTKSIQ